MTTPSQSNEAVEALRPALLDIAEGLDVAVTPTQADLLLSYLALLHHWNATYNLTAVRDPARMLVQHVADCLAVIRPLARQLATKPNARLLDAGSGAGLPGIVVAIMDRRIAVVCADSVGKKAAFIQQAAVSLHLSNLRALHARIEQIDEPSFDVIASRAFASLADFTHVTRPRLAERGVWMAMKGKAPRDEIDKLPSDVQMFHVEQLSVPGLAAERCLVWMRPA